MLALILAVLPPAFIYLIITYIYAIIDGMVSSCSCSCSCNRHSYLLSGFCPWLPSLPLLFSPMVNVSMQPHSTLSWIPLELEVQLEVDPKHRWNRGPRSDCSDVLSKAYLLLPMERVLGPFCWPPQAPLFPLEIGISRLLIQPRRTTIMKFTVDLSLDPLGLIDDWAFALCRHPILH